MRLAAFIDVNNLFCCCLRKFQRKVDYKKLVGSFREHGELLRVTAYNQPNDKALGFNRILTDLGVQLKMLPNFNVNIPLTLDVVRVIDSVEGVIIASNDLNLVPCIEYIKERGKLCLVYGFRLQTGTKNVADKWYELKEDSLREEIENGNAITA